MPRAAKNRLLRADVWKPLHLQLVVFPTTSPVDLDEDWFRDLTGKAATSITKRPVDRTYMGDFGHAGSSLSINVDLLRITITVGPKIDPEKMPMQFPTLGTVSAILPSFVKLCDKFLKIKYPPIAIKRLGFSGRLLQLMKSHASGYKLLGTYLPTVRIDPRSHDFIFRINRKRKSRAGPSNLQLNRVSTWSVITTTIQAAEALSSGQVSEPKAIIKPQFACSLEFDINTAHEFPGEIPYVR
jgi:hypothetical protein